MIHKSQEADKRTLAMLGAEKAIEDFVKTVWAVVKSLPKDEYDAVMKHYRETRYLF